MNMFHEARGKHTAYMVFTEVGPFIFRTELEGLNFMIDANTGRLPYLKAEWDTLPKIYTTEEAVDEYIKRVEE
jgi:hypothetical protein